MGVIAISNNGKKSVELCIKCTALIDEYKNLRGASAAAKAKKNDGGPSMCISCEEKLKDIGWKLSKPKATCTNCRKQSIIEAENLTKTERLCRVCVLELDPFFPFQ